MFVPKLGVSFHGIWQEVTPEAIHAVAHSEVATLELFAPLFRNDRPAAIAAFNGLFASYPVRPMTIHSTFGVEHDLSSLDSATHARALDAVRDGLELAVALGAPMVVIHASSEPIPAVERDARREQTLAVLSEVTDEYRAAGVRGALELLPRTCLCNTLGELTWFLDQLDPAAGSPGVYGVCLDVNHAMDRYATLPDMVRTLGPRLFTTHLSDYDGVDEKHWLPGRGIIDWKGLTRALADIDYQGPFNYECASDGQTPAERVRSYEVNFHWLSNL